MDPSPSVALPKQTKKHSREYDAKAVNEYSRWKASHDDRHTEVKNDLTAVTAYELRRRGYDVYANYSTDNATKENLAQRFDINSNDVKNVDLHRNIIDDVKAKTNSHSIRDLWRASKAVSDELKNQDVGTRGIVMIKGDTRSNGILRDESTTQAFAYEIIDAGKGEKQVQYIDTRTGKETSGSIGLETALANSKYKVSYCRLDDKKFKGNGDGITYLATKQYEYIKENTNILMSAEEMKEKYIQSERVRRNLDGLHG